MAPAGRCTDGAQLSPAQAQAQKRQFRANDSACAGIPLRRGAERAAGGGAGCRPVRNGNGVERGDFAELERELLTSLRKRGRAALERLAERFGPELARAAYLYLGDAHAAEDVAQETLIAAWDGARRCRHETRLRPWLFGILFNQCRKYRRSLWRRIRRERVAARRRVEAHDGGRENDEQLEMLRQALGKLDDGLRAVIILRFGQNFSIAQAAEALDLPEGTVKSRTHSAIQKLREYMRPS